MEQKYSITSVQEHFKKGTNMKFIFFWGHHHSKDGSITKTCLSQWWMSTFIVNGDTYCCMEQDMMAEKAPFRFCFDGN